MRLTARPHRSGGPSSGASRSGFSLLEIILALAILAGAIAVLSEVTRLGLENTRVARDMTRAQLLCESKLAEITAGITPAESVEETPYETLDGETEPDWLYSVEVNLTGEEGLLEVRVRVTKDLPPQKRPVEVSLVRWIRDPGV